MFECRQQFSCRGLTQRVKQFTRVGILIRGVDTDDELDEWTRIRKCTH
jgi:hypothetical protein